MMGRQRSQHDLFSYRINLEHRIRKDHPLRKVQELVDFSFVREEVARFYGRNGNASVDPVVLLKMMFLLFFDNVASERELMKVIAERLDYLWFLGFGLDDELPNHSVLSKARARWGEEVFRGLFERTILQCVEAGLVDGSKLHMDSSLIDADASTNSVVQAGPELTAALKKAYQSQEAKLEELPKPPVEIGEDAPSDGVLDAASPAEGAAGQSKKKPVAQAVNATHVSTTDPQAAMVRGKNTTSRPRYKVHRAIDDAHGVITALTTTAGNVDDSTQLDVLCQQHEANTEEAVKTVVADSKYGTIENFIRCRQAGIATHMADLAGSQRSTGSREGIFDESEFRYDAQSDTLLCPAGQKMKPRRLNSTWRTEYTLPAAVCASCKLRERCTRSKSGRSVQRHRQQDLLEEGRKQSASRAARRDRRRRKHLMEGSFADAANNHGFKRARWRGLGRQQIQGSMIAACQNIRILIARGTRRSQPASQAANIIMMTPVQPVSGSSAAFYEAHQALNRCFAP